MRLTLLALLTKTILLVNNQILLEKIGVSKSFIDSNISKRLRWIFYPADHYVCSVFDGSFIQRITTFTASSLDLLSCGSLRLQRLRWTFCPADHDVYSVFAGPFVLRITTFTASSMDLLSSGSLRLQRLRWTFCPADHLNSKMLNSSLIILEPIIYSIPSSISVHLL